MTSLFDQPGYMSDGRYKLRVPLADSQLAALVTVSCLYCAWSVTGTTELALRQQAEHRKKHRRP